MERAHLRKALGVRVPSPHLGKRRGADDGRFQLLQRWRRSFPRRRLPWRRFPRRRRWKERKGRRRFGTPPRDTGKAESKEEKFESC